MGVYRRTYSKHGKKKVSRYWYCVDPNDGREKSLRVTDKAVAEIMLGRLREARELRRAGIETFVEARLAQPMELLDEFMSTRTRARAANTQRAVRHRLTVFFREVRSIAELTPAKIGKILDAIRHRKGLPKTAEPVPLSGSSFNQYLDTLASFFNWLVREKRWHENPVNRVERAVVKGQTFERWALTVEQLEQLVERTPLHRAAIYVLAANTGLRRSELDQVLEADLDLEGGRLRVRAKTTKTDVEDQWLPLNAWTVAILRRYLEAFPPGKLPPRHAPSIEPRGERLFTSIPMILTLHRDLKKFVGVTPRNAAGEVFDLHALRTTFGTLLAREGVPVQVAKDLMRHADIRTTLKSYTKLVLHDHRAAVARIQPKKTGERDHRGAASG
jgi:integrase